MRPQINLSDGQIRETVYGVAIGLESGHFAAWTMVTWTALFILDQKTINKIVTEKIEDCQQRLSYWQGLKGKKCSMTVIDEEFMSHARKKQENSEK